MEKTETTNLDGKEVNERVRFTVKFLSSIVFFIPLYCRAVFNGVSKVYFGFQLYLVGKIRSTFSTNHKLNQERFPFDKISQILMTDRMIWHFFLEYYPENCCVTKLRTIQPKSWKFLGGDRNGTVCTGKKFSIYLGIPREVVSFPEN